VVELLPEEIASIPKRGDFAVLPDDEYAKLRRWLTAITAKKTKQRRRPPSEDKSPRKLTARQVEVMQLVGECKGNFAEVGRRLRLDRKTVKEHYEAALKKLRQVGVKSPERKLKAKTTQLPEDRRGQVNVADDLRRSQDI